MTSVQELDLSHPEFIGFIKTPDVPGDEAAFGLYMVPTEEGSPAVCLTNHSKWAAGYEDHLTPGQIEGVAQAHDSVLDLSILDNRPTHLAISALAIEAAKELSPDPLHVEVNIVDAPSSIEISPESLTLAVHRAAEEYIQQPYAHAA